MTVFIGIKQAARGVNKIRRTYTFRLIDNQPTVDVFVFGAFHEMTFSKNHDKVQEQIK